MTRKEVNGMMPIMQAFIEGKTIQCSKDGIFWEDTIYPTFRDGTKYRIKPEPKYRPFNTAEESHKTII